MSIESEMIPRGVFPEVHEATPEELRRDLEFYHEGFRNYSSLEEEPDGLGALLELVDAGFVLEFDSYDDLRAHLGNAEPITSKLAVIKSVKEGIVKYRLILDCRISGPNDAALRRERILFTQVLGCY